MYRLVMLCVLCPSKAAIVGSLIGWLIVVMTVGVYAAQAVAEPSHATAAEGNHLIRSLACWRSCC
jgi:hypothetical protein